MMHIGLGRAMFLCISPCVTPWIPSAPTTRSPVYKVLSAQCAVTRDLPLLIWTTFFPSSTLAGAFRNKTDSRARRSITKNPYPNLCESALAELTQFNTGQTTSTAIASYQPNAAAVLLPTTSDAPAWVPLRSSPPPANPIGPGCERHWVRWLRQRLRWPRDLSWIPG